MKEVLDLEIDKARKHYEEIRNKYPLVLTRDLAAAKRWVREQCLGTTRYGMLASSGGLRLKPDGIFVKNEISVAHWFLNSMDDVRSSYALEDVVTEFDIQGLEVDYAIVAWDADLRFSDGQWTHNRFSGTTWQRISDNERRSYLLNAYRVLLTRSRQGMVIYIPRGDETDATRPPKFYDGTYNYLRSIGIEEI